MDNSFMNNPDFLAQIGHSFVPYSIILTFAWFGLPVWIPILFFLVWAPVKEFWYDATYEHPPQPFINNAIDFTFYMVGITVAIAVIFT